jgi:flagellar export protein FliJ
MARDPLAALIRLRRLACDEALRDLAAALDAESRAVAAIAVLQQAMAREEEAASDLGADDLAVEAFGRWFRRAQAELASAELARNQAEAETARARVILSGARAALEAAEAELQRRATAEQALRLRTEQAALDEMAQQRDRSEEAPHC